MEYTGGYVIAAIFVLIVGVLSVVRPELVWKFKHMLTVRDGEPTQYFLVSMRISGVMMILLSLFVLFCAFTGRI
ncbi:MAG: hypothetical protein IJE90_03460 [Clostridia bacterium]|nr:hypothetical protein [Clostridia bacterium]